MRAPEASGIGASSSMVSCVLAPAEDVLAAEEVLRKVGPLSCAADGSVGCRSLREATAACLCFDLLDWKRPISCNFRSTKVPPASKGAIRMGATNIGRRGKSILYVGVTAATLLSSAGSAGNAVGGVASRVLDGVQRWGAAVRYAAILGARTSESPGRAATR